MNTELFIKLLLIVGIGAGIGWVTNYVAIKMLFRPYKEINLGLFKIQGLLPKRKHEIGESIAEVIQTELVSLQEILKSLDGEKLEKEMSAVIDLKGNVDFKGIIVKNVDAFSLEKLEEVTYTLAAREFKHIEVIGAILGAIIGFVQFIIGMIM